MITDITQDDCNSNKAIALLKDCVVTPDMQVVLDKLMKSIRSPILSNDGLPQITNGM